MQFLCIRIGCGNISKFKFLILKISNTYLKTHDLLFFNILSDDNYFLSHRLNLAITAKADGYDVFVLAFENDPKFSDMVNSHGFGFIKFNQRAHGLWLMANMKPMVSKYTVVNSLWFILMFQMWREQWDV